MQTAMPQNFLDQRYADPLTQHEIKVIKKL